MKIYQRIELSDNAISQKKALTTDVINKWAFCNVKNNVIATGKLYAIHTHPTKNIKLINVAINRTKAQFQALLTKNYTIFVSSE